MTILKKDTFRNAISLECQNKGYVLSYCKLEYLKETIEGKKNSEFSADISSVSVDDPAIEFYKETTHTEFNEAKRFYYFKKNTVCVISVVEYSRPVGSLNKRQRNIIECWVEDKDD